MLNKLIRKTRRNKKPMTNGIIGRLKFGLGNQLFIYAACIATQKVFNFPIYLYNDKSVTKNYRPFFKNTHITNRLPAKKTENVYSLNGVHLNVWKIEDIPSHTNIIILNSFFHSLTTIRSVIPEVRENILSVLSTKYSVKIDADSGFIHVRRGDYVKGMWKGAFNNLDSNYYSAGIKVVQEANTNLKKWYIFSDDIKYCKKQEWSTTLPIEYYDSSDELECLYAMSKCKSGAVIANSTYSWWGAVLGCGLDGKVVRPKKYFSYDDELLNLYPDVWVSL